MRNETQIIKEPNSVAFQALGGDTGWILVVIQLPTRTDIMIVAAFFMAWSRCGGWSVYQKRIRRRAVDVWLHRISVFFKLTGVFPKMWTLYYDLWGANIRGRFRHLTIQRSATTNLSQIWNRMQLASGLDLEGGKTSISNRYSKARPEKMSSLYYPSVTCLRDIKSSADTLFSSIQKL